MGRPPRSSMMNVADIEKELATERRAAALHAPLLNEGMHRRLTDEELMMRETEADLGQFDVPPEFVPDDMMYQWHRTEVFGQPDKQSIANAERNGWRSVPASRHPGWKTPSGYEGPIEVDGLRLMELPAPEGYNRHRTFYLKAQQQKRNGQEMLGRAPMGTGPRSHPGVRPQVSRSIEPLSVE